jgi:signal transduction histidine kinase
MKERVQILGGSLEVGSPPGRGTQVRASFPTGTAAMIDRHQGREKR